MIVDSSVWIDFFNHHASREVEILVRAIETDHAISIPGVVVTEVLMGLRNEREAQQVAKALDAFEITPEPTRADYADAARLYRACRAQGVTVRTTIDCLIAQLCLREGVPLLTKDRDFAQIARCAALELV